MHSIRWRLVVSYVVLALLTVSVMGLTAMSLVERYVEHQARAELSQNAEAMARRLVPQIVPEVQRDALRELVKTSSFLGDARVRILDAQGSVLADSSVGELSFVLSSVELNTPAGGDVPFSVVIRPGGSMSSGLQLQWEHLSSVGRDLYVLWGADASAAGIQPRWFDMGGGLQFEGGTVLPPEADASTLVVSEPVSQSGRTVAYVELSRDSAFVANALRTTRRAILLAGAGALAVAAALGVVVSQGLSSPLRELGAAAQEMGDGNLAVRAPVHGFDEIGQLALQFNRMAERLEASFAAVAEERDTLRRFSEDASHELRTPITALKAFNDLMQHAAASDPKARAEFLAESQVQIERLEHITNDLLTLSRLDAGMMLPEPATCDISELARTTATGLSALARDRGLDLQIEVPAPAVHVSCGPDRMRMALANLLDNALKYTPRGGTVSIGLEVTGSEASVWVRDTGPGIAPDDLPHIFERFYRGKDVGTGGSGLGLAIVEQIALTHGGHVCVTSSLGEGSTFTLTLPTVPAA